MSEHQKLTPTVKRAIGRTGIVLLAAGIITCGLYALSQSSLASPLALAMNVSSPLLQLNEIVQGASGESNRARFGNSLEPGLSHVARDVIVLCGVACAVVLVQSAAQHRRRKKARRAAGLPTRQGRAHR